MLAAMQMLWNFPRPKLAPKRTRLPAPVSSRTSTEQYLRSSCAARAGEHVVRVPRRRRRVRRRRGRRPRRRPYVRGKERGQQPAATLCTPVRRRVRHRRGRRRRVKTEEICQLYMFWKHKNAFQPNIKFERWFSIQYKVSLKDAFQYIINEHKYIAFHLFVFFALFVFPNRALGAQVHSQSIFLAILGALIS